MIVEKKSTIGVDLGGTKIHAGLVIRNIIANDILTSTPSKGSEKEVVNKLIDTIEQLDYKSCQGIGIGVPSIVDSKKGIVYDTVAIPSWKEVHLKQILEAYFKIPVFVNNDSNCFILGEKYFGKGRFYSNIIGITLGTGLGTGIIINDRLYEGSNTAAGEIGCIKYKDGIIENYCSGQFFKKYQLDGLEVFMAARQGDKESISKLQSFGRNLADVLKIILYAYDPEIIIIGGSVSNAFDYFIDASRNALKEDFMFPGLIEKIKIEKSDLVNSAVLGAAALIYSQQ